MPITTWRNFTISVSAMNVAPFCLKSFHHCCLNLLRVFLPLRQSTVFFVCEFRHCFQWLIHDWNYMSLLSNIVQLLSTDSILPLSSKRLFDSWWLLLFPQFRYGLWSFEFSSSDQYEVLEMSSILNYSVVHCFAQFQGRTKPKQSEAEQSPVFLTCMILPWPFP